MQKDLLEPDFFGAGLSFLILALLLVSSGCANRRFEPCVKDGRQYGLTDEWIFSEKWYSCYLRGLSCTQGGCWEAAREEFMRAVRQRDRDERWVRTYGMHRLPEYFPNRELGVALYHLDDFDLAIRYLTISLEQCESAKTRYYLNKVRRKKLLFTMEDKEAPQLILDPYPKAMATPRLNLSGLALDDTFVADVLIKISDDAEPLSLMELSRPASHRFSRDLFLKPGINNISIRAVDLLGKQADQRITILVDQEGPMIFFSQDTADSSSSSVSIQGFLYDPSGVNQLYLNGNNVNLIMKETASGNGFSVSHPVYLFSYSLSSEERQKGVLSYQAVDSFENRTSGTISLSLGEEQRGEQQPGREQAAASPAGCHPILVAMAPEVMALDIKTGFVFCQAEGRRSVDPVQIRISQIPQETFEEEICLEVRILARSRIREIFLNGRPVLSMYGLNWAKAFERTIREYLYGKPGGSFLFQRVIKLKEGENIIRLQVVDVADRIWEKTGRILKKTRSIHQLENRWRMAIPFIWGHQRRDDQGRREQELTYQLMEAFVHQARFKVIDLENLPVIIEEKELSYHLGSPFLGLSPDCRIWIDTFLLGYIQEAEDSLTLSASLVDLETGEILATKDICEEVDSSLLIWQEGLREHTFQMCSALAFKFKEYFPLCEGKVISLRGNELTTDICRNDGLKRGMRLLLYDDGHGSRKQGDNSLVLGEAKVIEVDKRYSEARLMEYVNRTEKGAISADWRVITR